MGKGRQVHLSLSLSRYGEGGLSRIENMQRCDGVDRLLVGLRDAAVSPGARSKHRGREKLSERCPHTHALHTRTHAPCSFLRVRALQRWLAGPARTSGLPLRKILDGGPRKAGTNAFPFPRVATARAPSCSLSMPTFLSARPPPNALDSLQLPTIQRVPGPEFLVDLPAPPHPTSEGLATRTCARTPCPTCAGPPRP